MPRAGSSSNGYSLPTSSSPRDYYGSTSSDPSVADNVLTALNELHRRLGLYWNARGRALAWSVTMQVAAVLRANLAARRLLSFPHLLVVLWMLVLLWGERWTFTSQIQSCDWDHWEDWVSLLAVYQDII
jgi:ethanolamine phosphate phosphodiesterase